MDTSRSPRGSLREQNLPLSPPEERGGPASLSHVPRYQSLDSIDSGGRGGPAFSSSMRRNASMESLDSEGRGGPAFSSSMRRNVSLDSLNGLDSAEEEAPHENPLVRMRRAVARSLSRDPSPERSPRQNEEASPEGPVVRMRRAVSRSKSRDPSPERPQDDNCGQTRVLSNAWRRTFELMANEDVVLTPMGQQQFGSSLRGLPQWSVADVAGDVPVIRNINTEGADRGKKTGGIANAKAAVRSRNNPAFSASAEFGLTTTALAGREVSALDPRKASMDARKASLEKEKGQDKLDLKSSWGAPTEASLALLNAGREEARQHLLQQEIAARLAKIEGGSSLDLILSQLDLKEEEVHQMEELINFSDGSTYSGQFLSLNNKDNLRLIMRHGYGIYVFADESMYEGGWSYDKQHGEGRAKYANGATFHGVFEEGDMIYGQMITPDACEYLGEFEFNTFKGLGVMYFPDKSVYKGMFEGGKRHGPNGEYRFSNSDVYVGDWVNGLQHGNGVLTTRKGHVYEGQWAEGRKHGRGVLKYVMGEVYQGEFSHGTRHGIGRYTCPDGSDYLGEWKHDKRHGRGRQRAIELVQSLPGAPKEFCTYDGDWDRGKKHGQGELVHSTGEKYTGAWQHDEKHGEGKMEGHDFTYTGGWVHGKREGKGLYVGKGYTYQGEWKKGLQHGRGTSSAVSSGCRYEGEWFEGKPHGEGKLVQPGVDRHGDVIWFGTWEHGKRVGDTKVDSDNLVLFLSYSEPGLLSKVKARDKKIDSRIEERFEKDMTTSPLVYIRKGAQPAEPTSNPPDSTQSPLASESSQPNTTT